MFSAASYKSALYEVDNALTTAAILYGTITMSTVLRNNKRRKAAMAGTIRARMKGGMLELLDKVDLPEGTEVSVTILDVPSRQDKEAFHRAAGGWKGTVDVDTLIENIYADRLISTRPAPRL
jgi:predicted DNA-binding antitoxin AbrB/MazE fold protein